MPRIQSLEHGGEPRRGRSRRVTSSLAEINVVPLVDVSDSVVAGDVIHDAFHSSFVRMPIVQRAGWLHADGLPSRSHERTFQNTVCDDTGAFPP